MFVFFFLFILCFVNAFTRKSSSLLRFQEEYPKWKKKLKFLFYNTVIINKLEKKIKLVFFFLFEIVFNYF